jgi:hypothetical protein
VCQFIEVCGPVGKILYRDKSGALNECDRLYRSQSRSADPLTISKFEFEPRAPRSDEGEYSYACVFLLKTINFDRRFGAITGRVFQPLGFCGYRAVSTVAGGEPVLELKLNLPAEDGTVAPDPGSPRADPANDQ